ncbi:MAG: hypothetical protein IPM24_07270 [Bryobacterales bacterium]|nr:hypothetical protein [Bryobacterales bacterium]
MTTSPPPAFRRLRAYLFDPGLSGQIDTAAINEATLRVGWEEALEPGPVGEYLEVVDFDPATGCFYPPVDLNDHILLAQDGLPPSEGTPQFHQQMVYAVAMTTIRHFEQALGRTALWAAREYIEAGQFRREFVQRLRIYPHALREPNAYYSPAKKALLFGYFPAARTNPGRNLPGGLVFTCLSHDVVAHEVTHALLDGIHARFTEASNPDVLAFHEAFADIVALFQHFSYPEALRHQIARTRGDLASQNLLGQLAQQFGEAIGTRGALRDALGFTDPATGIWRPHKPDPALLQQATQAHDRGAILVAAVFDAFLTIYKSRVADLLRLATGGTGVLPAGDLHPDLVNRLAQEAAKSARHVLSICIRALDYCPPVDITFGDYLRAIVTADFDMVQDDERGYRLTIIEGFRRRGIYPRDVRTLSVESLRWKEPKLNLPRGSVKRLVDSLRTEWDLRTNREAAFKLLHDNCRRVHVWLSGLGLDEEAQREIGLALDAESAPATLPRNADGKPVFEVHSVRVARRVSPDGQLHADAVIEITQKRMEEGLGRKFKYRGGCTLLIDLHRLTVKYAIVKSIWNEGRLERERQFRGNPAQVSLRATYSPDPGGRRMAEPFALLHRED